MTHADQKKMIAELAYYSRKMKRDDHELFEMFQKRDGDVSDLFDRRGASARVRRAVGGIVRLALSVCPESSHIRKGTSRIPRSCLRHKAYVS